MSARSNTRSREYRYLLGDSRREAARLRRQARLWDPTAHALFDKVKVGPGWRVLEVGPGKGSLHMELRRRVKGPIDAVERSRPFAAALRTRCSRDGLGQGTIWETDLIEAPLPRAAHRASWWETLRSPQEKMPQREACLAGGYIATRLADGKSVRFKRMK